MQNEDVRHPAAENADLNVLGRLLLVSALLGPATGMLVGWVATSPQAAYVGAGIVLGGFAGLFLAPLVQVVNVAVFSSHAALWTSAALVLRAGWPFCPPL